MLILSDDTLSSNRINLPTGRFICDDENDQDTDDDFVRSLIASSFTVAEADEVVNKYGYCEQRGSFEGREDSVELYEDKLWYLGHILGAYVAGRCDESEDALTRARIDYYSVLSASIMPNWR